MLIHHPYNVSTHWLQWLSITHYYYTCWSQTHKIHGMGYEGQKGEKGIHLIHFVLFLVRQKNGIRKWNKKME